MTITAEGEISMIAETQYQAEVQQQVMRQIIKLAGMTWKEVQSRWFPRMRRLRPVGIVRNGSRCRVYECAWYGDRDSMCTEWPKPLHVSRFEDFHNEGGCWK